jgi:hypothetical protein
MMNDPKKSDFVKVAMRSMNKAGLVTAVESRSEGRAEGRGEHEPAKYASDTESMRVSQALERVPQVARVRKE